MREKADGALAVRALAAQLGAEAIRVHPELKDAVGVGAGVAALAHALPEFRAGVGRVLAHARVATAGLFTRVSKGAVSPVMDVAAFALLDL